jgi:hypothetical protein
MGRLARVPASAPEGTGGDGQHQGVGCPANVEARACVLPLTCAAARGLYAFRPADSIPAIQKYRSGVGLRAAEERKCSWSATRHISRWHSLQRSGVIDTRCSPRCQHLWKLIF